MNDRISTREMENLSAYLDDQLAGRERQRLESMLAQDAELRSELEGLRQLRSLLRAQPKARAPRNFTLTPAMAGARHAPSPAPTAYFSLRLASILATIFFVMVFAGDLIGRRVQPPPRQMKVSEQQQAIPFGMGGGGGGGGGWAPAPPPAMAQEVPVEKSVAQTDTLESAASNVAPDSTAQADLSAAAPLSVIPEGSPMPPGGEAEAPPAAPFEPGAGIPAPAEEGRNQGAPVEIARAQPVLSWSLLQLLQIFLALLAVGTGAAAFLMRRSARH